MRHVVTAFALLLSGTTMLGAPRSRLVRQPPAVWASPQCESVLGLAGFYFSRDEGRTFSTNAMPDPENLEVHPVLTDVPNRLLAVLGDRLYESDDAGCVWAAKEFVPDDLTGITAAPGGGAYAWSAETSHLVRITPSDLTVLATPEPIRSIGVDRGSSSHLIAASAERFYESFDGGSTWRDNGPAPVTSVRAIAFDPSDLRHVVVGFIGGHAVSRDGGISWESSLTEWRTVVSVAFGPSDSNVIWMQSYWLGRESIEESLDGGDTVGLRLSMNDTSFHMGFDTITIAAHPSRTDMVAFVGAFGLTVFDRSASSLFNNGTTHQWESVLWSPADVIYTTGTTFTGHILSRQRNFDR